MINKNLTFTICITIILVIILGIKVNSVAFSKQTTSVGENTILVYGLNSQHPEFKIGFDSKKKHLTVFDRQNKESFNSLIGNKRFFSILVIDANNVVKVALELNGNDKGSSDKLNKLNGLKFNYGDTIHIWHSDYKNLKLKGKLDNIVDSPIDPSGNITANKGILGLVINRHSLSFKRIYSDNIKNNTIHFLRESTKYKPKSENSIYDEIGFNINFNPYTQKIYLTDKSQEIFNPNIGKNKYTSIAIHTKNGREKIKIDLNGNDTPLSSKLATLEKINFNYGDIITIFISNTKNINISGEVLNSQNDFSKEFTKKKIIRLAIKELGLSKVLEQDKALDIENQTLFDNVISFSSNDPDLSRIPSSKKVVFKLGFDTRVHHIYIIQKSVLNLGNPDINSKVLSIKHMSSIGVIKSTVDLLSSDTGFAKDIHKLENTPYLYGDIIVLDFYNSKNHHILGNIINNTQDYSKGIKYKGEFASFMFQLTKFGLKEIASLPAPPIKITKNNSYKIENEKKAYSSNAKYFEFYTINNTSFKLIKAAD